MKKNIIAAASNHLVPYFNNLPSQQLVVITCMCCHLCQNENGANLNSQVSFPFKTKLEDYF